MKKKKKINLINSKITELYIGPSSKFYYDFLDDDKTDAAIKFIEAKFKEFDSLKAVYKKARTKLENYMDEQVKDLISTDSTDETMNSLVDSLRFEMLDKIKKVVKDELGFKDLIKDGAENSEVINELKQKIKAKVEELKKEQEEDKKERDSFISNLANDLASEATDKLFEAWKEKNEQQQYYETKKSLINFVSTDERFKDHYELTEIVFEQLYGEKSLDELSKIYDEAEKEKFVAKYKEFVEIYERNLGQLRDISFGELKEALDLELFRAGKWDLQDFIFGEYYVFDDEDYHKVDKKYIGPDGKEKREKGLTAEEYDCYGHRIYDEEKKAKRACLYLDKAREILDPDKFKKLKESVEEKVAMAKKNFEKYRRVYEKYRNELFDKYPKKYALYKNMDGFNDWIENLLIVILSEGQEGGKNRFEYEIGSLRTVDHYERRFRYDIAKILKEQGYFSEMAKICLDLIDESFKCRFGMTIDEFDKKYECKFSFRDAFFKNASESGIEQELDYSFFYEYNLNATDTIKLLYVSIKRQLNVYEKWKKIKFGFSVFDCPWYVNIFFFLPPVYILLVCYISYGLKNNKENKVIKAVENIISKELEENGLSDIEKASTENFIYGYDNDCKRRGFPRAYDSIKSMFMESADWRNLDESKDKLLKKYINRAKEKEEEVTKSKSNKIIPKREFPDQENSKENNKSKSEQIK